MTFLLLGGSGQVGWELRRALSAHGPVVAPAREACDLTNADALRKQVDAVGPRVIINAAAYTAVDRAESDPEHAHAVNAEAVALLAELARQRDVPLVHYSTDYVYDGCGARPYREDDAPAPLNVYGRSKLAGDLAIQNSGAKHLVFRTSWVYGPRGSNFLRTILRLARERETLSIVDDQVGAPTWCRVIAEVTSQVLAQLLAPRPAVQFAETSGVYHLAMDGSTSWYGFAKAIIDNDPRRSEHVVREVRAIRSAEFPAAARRPSNSRLDCTKLHEVFGLAPAHWEQGLRMVLEEI